MQHGGTYTQVPGGEGAQADSLLRDAEEGPITPRDPPEGGAPTTAGGAPTTEGGAPTEEDRQRRSLGAQVPDLKAVAMESDISTATPGSTERSALSPKEEEPVRDPGGPKEKKKSQGDRGQHLEALRALACIMVVFFHSGDLMVGGFPCVYEIRLSWLQKSLVRWTPLVGFVSGQYPVSIFFTLSGYVLVQKFIHTRDVADLERQCHKRLIRLVPPCVVVYSVYWLLLRNHFYQQWHGGPPAHDPADAFAEHGFIGLLFLAKGPVVQLWTILYEFFAPLFLLCIGVLSPRPTCCCSALRAAVAGAAFILTPLLCTYTVPLSCFAVGFYVAEVERAVAHPVSSDGAEWKSAACQAGVVCIALPVSLAAHWYLGHRDDLEGCSHFEECELPQSMAAATFLWLVVSSKVLRLVLSYCGLHLVAFLTFAVYLSHLLVLQSLHYWRTEGPPGQGPMFLVVITVAAASALYLFVEKPAIWLSGQYAEWMMTSTK